MNSMEETFQLHEDMNDTCGLADDLIQISGTDKKSSRLDKTIEIPIKIRMHCDEDTGEIFYSAKPVEGGIFVLRAESRYDAIDQLQELIERSI